MLKLTSNDANYCSLMAKIFFFLFKISLLLMNSGVARVTKLVGQISIFFNFIAKKGPNLKFLATPLLMRHCCTVMNCRNSTVMNCRIYFKMIINDIDIFFRTNNYIKYNFSLFNSQETYLMSVCHKTEYL
jgi:hypothetical protein